jgi:hypothetical protein
MSNLFLRNTGEFAQVDYASITGAVTTSTSLLGTLTNATTADVAMTSASTATYFAGPTVTQGSSGTWYASGAVTLTNTAAAAQVYAKLWDGTTVIASGAGKVPVANQAVLMALSGVITSPSSNIKISASSNSSTTSMAFNFSGNSADCSIAAVRLA